MGDLNSKVNAVVWLDIPVVNLDRAVSFYSSVLARKVEKMTFGDYTFAVVDHADGNGACLVEGKPSDEGPLVYLNVNGRLEDAEKLVSATGGKVLEPKHSIGPHGFRAIVMDSEGNRVALHSN